MSISNIDAVPLAEVAREEAASALFPLQARQQALIAALEKTEIRDDEDMRRVTDKIALASALREEADTRLDPIGGPYRDAGVAVRNVAIEFTAPLKQREVAANKAIGDYRKRQREAAAARANEQADRERQLRIQAGLDAPVAAPVRQADVQLAPVRSDYRGQVFDRKVIKVEITDPRLLPDTVLKAPGVIAAMETAVRQLAKLTREIPGAKIDDDKSSSVKVG